jgi:hypothetical protein
VSTKWRIEETKTDLCDVSRNGRAFAYDAGDLDDCLRRIRKNRRYDPKDIIFYYPIDGAPRIVKNP